MNVRFIQLRMIKKGAFVNRVDLPASTGLLSGRIGEWEICLTEETIQGGGLDCIF